jgi:YegS/Rv2252/BmrU family lipid kinase
MTTFFEGKRALVVINPISGKRTTQAQLFDITDLFSTQGLETTVYTTRCRGDAQQLVARRGEDFDIVVVRGGDGTFSEVVSGVMTLQKQPLLGYIPAGSTNDLARTLRIPINNNAEAIDVILNGQPLYNDIGTFNGKHFVYIASCGAFIDIAFNTPQAQKNRWGRAAYFAHAPAAIRGIKPIHMKIATEEGLELEDDFIFCSFTNSSSIAGAIKLPRRLVGLNDGRFELLLIRYPKSFAELSAVLRRVIVQDYRDPSVKLLHSRRMEIRLDEPTIWTIDGENGGMLDHVVIENVQNAIQIFRR